MEEPETMDQSPIDASDPGNGASGVPAASRPAPSPPPQVGLAQAGPLSCPTCGLTAPPGSSSYAYVLGRIEARFPRLSVEKEFAQATGRAETAGRTDQQAFHEVLSSRANRYLARHLCWVMSVQGLETYILQPRDPADLELLIEAVNPASVPWTSCVIGERGPIAPPELCNGLMLPIVIFDQIYTFTHEALINAIPKPERLASEDFRPAAQELFDRIMQMTDNLGATDEHRALNYLAMRYPTIYATAAEQFARDFSLTAVETRPSPLSSTRNILDVIFSFTNRNTDFTEKWFARVDVTEQYPFLVTKASPYYER